MTNLDKPLTIKYLQEYIKKSDYNPEKKEHYFYKLIEEVGELSEVIRKNKRLDTYGNQTIKGTIEEELYDVLYYVAALANVYNIDLEKCFELKEEINKVKWNKG
jgi:NTP pyrophosphatase (non-canonical NTP hydrolase)